MKKLLPQSIMHVVDVWFDDVDLATREYLLENHVTYIDAAGAEHLIGIEEAIEEMENVNESIQNEIEQLSKLARKNKAGYIRFIYT